MSCGFCICQVGQILLTLHGYCEGKMLIYVKTTIEVYINKAICYTGQDQEVRLKATSLAFQKRAPGNKHHKYCTGIHSGSESKLWSDHLMIH